MASTEASTPPQQQRTCADCRQPFEIGEGEINFFITRGLKLPKRCLACRKARRLLESA